MTTLGICAVRSGSERQAQRDIERAGFGTRIPSFRVAFNRHGGQHVQLRPLFPGMVFTYLEPGYGDLDEIEGVRVLKIAGQPLRIRGADGEELNRLERRCLFGDFNKVRVQPNRNGFGQFKQRKRRRRPRPGKRLRQAIT